MTKDEIMKEMNAMGFELSPMGQPQYMIFFHPQFPDHLATFDNAGLDNDATVKSEIELARKALGK